MNLISRLKKQIPPEILDRSISQEEFASNPLFYVIAKKFSIGLHITFRELKIVGPQGPYCSHCSYGPIANAAGFVLDSTPDPAKIVEFDAGNPAQKDPEAISTDSRSIPPCSYTANRNGQIIVPRKSRRFPSRIFFVETPPCCHNDDQLGSLVDYLHENRGVLSQLRVLGVPKSVSNAEFSKYF
ncbi:MAG: hypothetical protein V1735_01815 [Nanoarchaeota archaeon]